MIYDVCFIKNPKKSKNEEIEKSKNEEIKKRRNQKTKKSNKIKKTYNKESYSQYILPLASYETTVSADNT